MLGIEQQLDRVIQILGCILYSGSKDRSLRSWDLATGDELCEARHHRDYIISCRARYGGGHHGESTYGFMAAKQERQLGGFFQCYVSEHLRKK